MKRAACILGQGCKHSALLLSFQSRLIVTATQQFLNEGSWIRQNHPMHSLTFRNFCEFAGNLDGAVQAPKLVDKSSLFTLGPCPDAALGDRVDILRALVAALCHFWNELFVVHSLNQVFELG